MKHHILVYVLPALFNGIINAAGDFDVTRFVTEQRQKAEANISPQLHACVNLKDVETLLYQEEKAALNAYFTACNVPIATQMEFHDAFEKGIKARNSSHIKAASYLFDKKAMHDTENIGTDLLQTTKDIIVQYGLNPNFISIIYDAEKFKKDPNCVACAEIPTIMLSENPLKFFINDAATIVLNVNATFFLHRHTIEHEVTHIKEGHSVKQPVAKYIAAKFKKDDSPSIQKAYFEWEKNCEKQADLFPLLRFDNDDTIKQLMKNKIADHLSKHLAASVRASQEVSEDHHHPQFSDLLPYMIKIQTLKNDGARPLYELSTKKWYQFSWSFYGRAGIVLAIGFCYYWYAYKTPTSLRIAHD